jgi:hypothetical protein
LGAEGVQRGQRAARGDLEDRPAAALPAFVGRTVEVAVGGLDEPLIRVCSVCAPALGAEAV